MVVVYNSTRVDSKIWGFLRPGIGIATCDQSSALSKMGEMKNDQGNFAGMQDGYKS